ncbi:MAG: hypothetical protein IRY94_17920 [Rhodospirillaceae bacterium]|nr:hypothetical protein [Rhodospirillaceae bacterium]
MDEDRLNMEIRKFLKHVGVTSQREIEKAVRHAQETGRLAGRDSVKANIVLTIEALGLRHEIEHDIAFG